VRFILVDELVEMVPGKTVHAVKTLPPEEELFADHFPGFPVVPGVLLIEMMAQAAGKCLDAEETDRGKAMLVQVRRATFRQWVKPGVRADIYATVTASAPTYGQAACRISVDAQDVANADLVFAYLPYSQLTAGFTDDVLQRYLATKPQRLTE
jgi:3-hydroxyacyl-[acyl-carrier-protein] dehydratase